MDEAFPLHHHPLFGGRSPSPTCGEKGAALRALALALGGEHGGVGFGHEGLGVGAGGDLADAVAEAHLGRLAGDDGETMEVLGLILPDGAGAVALLEDVALVDDTDPTWRDLVAAAVGDETGDED